MADVPEVRAPSAPAAPKGGSSGLLTEIKSMPPWAWLLIAGGAFVGYKLFIAGGQSNTPATADTTGGTGAPSGDTGSSGDGSSGSSDGSGVVQPAPPPYTPPPPGAINSPEGPQPIGPIHGGGGRPGNPTPTPPGQQPRQTYTVRQGDTLSGIGQRYGVPWENIYDTNSAVIEQTAEQRSGHGSDHGNWIYPGEVLAIPS